jgi:hypothetical protein
MRGGGGGSGGGGGGSGSGGGGGGGGGWIAVGERLTPQGQFNLRARTVTSTVTSSAVTSTVTSSAVTSTMPASAEAFSFSSTVTPQGPLREREGEIKNAQTK